MNVLEQLKTVGVKKLSQISLYDYGNKLIAKNAADYLKQYGRWKSVDERGRIISAARKGEASAIRGEVYTKRLKELGVGRTKDQALEALFAEVFRKELQHGPGGVTAWTKTWQGVLDDLITFSGEDMMRNNKDSDWKWYTEKKIQYQKRPPVPPKPSVPRFTPV